MNLFDLFSYRKSRSTARAKGGFRPQLEALEDRAVPAVVVTERFGVLRFTGDGAANKVEIKDNGTHQFGNVRYRIDSSASFEDDSRLWVRPRSVIRTIIIDTGAGNDIVRYRLTSDLRAGQLRDIQVFAGGNNDTVWGEMVGNLQPGASLRMIGNGGSGNDQLAAFGFGDLQARPQLGSSIGISFNGEGDRDDIFALFDNDVDIADDSTLWMNLWGGDGTDYFDVDYAGDLHGQLLMHLEGGEHDDTINVRFLLSNVSTGTVGVPDAAESDWNKYAVVLGDGGNDTISYDVRNPNPDDSASVSARVFGGSGTDHFSFSPINYVEHTEDLEPGETVRTI